MDNAKHIGGMLKGGLSILADQSPILGDIRGSGLFVGVEIVESKDNKKPAAEKTKPIVNGLRNNRILAGIDGMHYNVVKIRPPMVFNETQKNLFS